MFSFACKGSTLVDNPVYNSHNPSVQITYPTSSSVCSRSLIILCGCLKLWKAFMTFSLNYYQRQFLKSSSLVRANSLVVSELTHSATVLMVT